MTTTSTYLDTYQLYEVPVNLLHTFYEDDGVTPRNLTGYTVEVTWWIRSQTPADTPQTFAGSLNDAANGVVSVPWSSAPEAFEELGTHEVQIWVGDGTYRHSSDIFTYAVIDGVSTSEPTV